MAARQATQSTVGRIVPVSDDELQSLRELKSRGAVSAEVAALRRQLANLPDNKLFKYEVPAGKSLRGAGRSLSFAARHHGKKYIPRGARENTIYFMLQPAEETAMDLEPEPNQC
jgi:hypothetical protein